MPPEWQLLLDDSPLLFTTSWMIQRYESTVSGRPMWEHDYNQMIRLVPRQAVRSAIVHATSLLLDRMIQQPLVQSFFATPQETSPTRGIMHAISRGALAPSTVRGTGPPTGDPQAGPSWRPPQVPPGLGFDQSQAQAAALIMGNTPLFTQQDLSNAFQMSPARGYVVPSIDM